MAEKRRSAKRAAKQRAWDRRQAERQQFDEALEELSLRARQYAERLTPDPHEQLDIAAAALIQFVKDWDRIKDKGIEEQWDYLKKPVFWARAGGGRKAASERGKAVRLANLGDTEVPFDELVEDRLLADQVLASMAPVQRLHFKMYALGYKQREIAEIRGISERSVRESMRAGREAALRSIS